MRVIAAPTGAGKTYAAVEHVAQVGEAVWLSERHQDVGAAVAAIEARGRRVGWVVPLGGKQPDGTPNCLHPEVIGLWQAKGYSYRQGFCPSQRCCERQGDPARCPYLASINNLGRADTIVATKALARTSGFFSAHGNQRRRLVVIDEDPVGLLRPPVVISREELGSYQGAVGPLVRQFEEQGPPESRVAAEHMRAAAAWLWAQIARQSPGGQPEAVVVPVNVARPTSLLPRKALAEGRRELDRAFRRLMRQDPRGTVRNVTRDLRDLARAAGATIFVAAQEAVFHLKVTVPRDKQVLVLDATANADLLRSLFAPRDVEVLFDEPVEPAGRVIQFMDFNGPRSYLNKTPRKLVRIIDAIGDLHLHGAIVLISHRSCVEDLAKASRHRQRIRTAYFGAVRGRNDLEARPDSPVACHVVAGSPKTTEEDRRRLALAVYGETILPFADLETVRRAVIGFVPHELEEAEERRRLIWEVRIKGYADPRMQAVYDHLVTAELTHAADRARVLIHKDAVVYLVTNEPCPKLWFVEMCFAGDYLDLSGGGRADFARNYAAFEAKARELLDAGKTIGNADVCRALDRKVTWGHRYWRELIAKYVDALEGERKFRWRRVS